MLWRLLLTQLGKGANISIHFNGGNPQIVPSPWDTGWPILIHSCLGPLKSTTHLASQLVYGYNQQAQWSNDGVAAASSDGGPTGSRGPPTVLFYFKSEDRGPDLRK